jgi:CubicO group peptidase (beta-lactamase class C family)
MAMFPARFWPASGTGPYTRDGGGVRTRLPRADSAGRNPLPGSVGDFSWDGAHGTYFWVDPKEELAAVLMLENPFDGEGRGTSIHYRHEMRYMVYHAVIGPRATEATVR